MPFHALTITPTVTELREDDQYQFCWGCNAWHGDFGGNWRIDAYGEVVDADDEPDDDDSYDEYDDSVIRNYSFRPQPEFHGEGPVYLGLELELELSDPYASVYSVAEDVQDAVGELAYLKDDGSISNGFELVTHPLSYDFAVNDFPWEAWHNEIDGRMRDSEGCGIHVHVSRAGFSDPLHMYRWIKLIHRNNSIVQSVGRRVNSRWARWERSDRNRAWEYAKGDPNSFYSERYSALNMQNRHTVEVRAFRATTEVDRILAILGLVDATVEYTRNLTASDVCKGGWGRDALELYVNQHPKYEPLALAL